MNVLYILLMVVSGVGAVALWLWVTFRRSASLDVEKGKVKKCGWYAIALMALCCVLFAIGYIGISVPTWRAAVSIYG